MSIARTSRVVIVGGGPAAASAASALRDGGHEGSILMLSAEQVAPYSRPPLSKAFLKGDASAQELQLDIAGVQLRRGSVVTRIDEAARIVVTEDGEVIPFDGLVIAAGSAARRPHDERIAVLATITDAERIRMRLRDARSVTVVGSGLLGFELASAAVHAGSDTTLIVRAGSLQARIGMLADILVEAARASGVAVIEAESGGRFDSGDVVVAGTGRVEADLVVAALGAVPSSHLLPDHSIAGWGVIVDEHCRVAPGIVAAGDVAVTRRADGTLHRDATWTNALAQARAAAAALIDDDAPPFRAVPYGWTEAFGTQVKFAGTISSDMNHEVVDGDLAAGRALLRWPGAAAAIGYRLPVARLQALAASRADAPSELRRVNG